MPDATDGTRERPQAGESRHLIHFSSMAIAPSDQVLEAAERLQQPLSAIPWWDGLPKQTLYVRAV